MYLFLKDSAMRHKIFSQANPLGPLINRLKIFSILALTLLSYSNFSKIPHRPRRRRVKILGVLDTGESLTWHTPGSQYPLLKTFIQAFNETVTKTKCLGFACGLPGVFGIGELNLNFSNLKFE